MTECCSSSSTTNKHPKKYACPINHKEYSSVEISTILHHINEPWLWDKKQQAYYFCEDPDCEVVYFGEDNSTISKAELRTVVGIKEKSKDSLLCYCFGVTKQAASNKAIKDFVIKKTKENTCTCVTRNPSGRCCLKDFPRT